MPRGTVVNWTREELEIVQALSGSTDAEAFAERMGIAKATVYSIKARIKSEGIDAILAGQSHRNESYTHGGGARNPETLEEQLARIYNITQGNAGRGGRSIQFNITIPSRLGEAWVERFGTQIRFVPKDDGILIIAVPRAEIPEPPAWLHTETDAET